MAKTTLPSLTLTTLEEAAREVIQLLDDYGSHVGSREMLLDPILFGFLSGRFSGMERQHQLDSPTSGRPQRIDFRYGTTNPVVIEFAVRPRKGGGGLSGSQNKSELKKLIKIPKTQARLRVLLLIDLCATPVEERDLKDTYTKIGRPKGSDSDTKVSILYVHGSTRFKFTW